MTLGIAIVCGALGVAVGEEPGTGTTEEVGGGGTGIELGGADPLRGDGVPDMVAFTFDDGPHELYTPRVLRALAKHDIPAAFFVVGNSLAGDHHADRRALLVRMRDAGHLIGNHTFHHARLTKLSAAARDAELARTAALVEETTGTAPVLVRPPYGASSPSLRAALTAAGLTEVRWNIDVRDWTLEDPEVLRRAVLDRIVEQRGGIVILHDTKLPTVRALPGLLAGLEAHNCKRLARGREPIVPVSLHYFLRDAGVPRAIPADVAARTQRYREALAARCEVAPRATRRAAG